ncbi:MAG: ergothioneine biosynthesis protein EgtB [Simplicispira sp.]|nr:ergothioneine biosynthesis protein EgtB [Simplicispira sp.]
MSALPNPHPVPWDALAAEQRYRAVREQTLALVAPLSAEDCCVQSMPDASPAKWHLGHTAWFFETFVLAACEPEFRPFDAAFRVLFNSYYNAVGARHPRPQRGLLTRPGLEQVLAYRADVDRRMVQVLASGQAAGLADVVELGLHHEQQHQELLLTDIKHLLSCHPLAPAYGRAPLPAGPAAPLAWQSWGEGVTEIGHGGPAFCYDNELPRHRVFLEPYALATRLVTNGEYAAFIAAGGYADPAWWLSEGWDWCQAQGREHPLYWQRSESGAWQEFTLGGLCPLDMHAPVVHVSLYEADAYARWSGARLPTEAEWEHAAAGLLAVGPAAPMAAGNFADSGHLHPASSAAQGLVQMFGDVWEWTSSSYGAYPGFRVGPGAIGEYNGKFMVNQYVLRGGSCATPSGHVRPSYRNFFPAGACWQFSGIRLARSL